MRRRLHGLMAALVLLTGVVQPATGMVQPVSAAPPAPKITICHYDSVTGTYSRITISTTSESMHQAHGDARPGQPVPRQPGYVFSASCVPTLQDTDNDGIPDASDNCPLVANSNQLNTDGDAQGNACDSDDDNDTVADGSDNCPLVANTSQTNTDGDAQGDACDTDDDNDTVADGSDNCPTSPTPARPTAMAMPGRCLRQRRRQRRQGRRHRQLPDRRHRLDLQRQHRPRRRWLSRRERGHRRRR